MAKAEKKIIPRWLKLKDAAEYSGIGIGRLKELAKKEDITGYRDPATKRGDWIFDKLSLDAYMLKLSDIAQSKKSYALRAAEILGDFELEVW